MEGRGGFHTAMIARDMSDELHSKLYVEQIGRSSTRGGSSHQFLMIHLCRRKAHDAALVAAASSTVMIRMITVLQ